MDQVYINDIGAHVGESVTLKGWLYNKRSSGSIHFLLIRDGTGTIQCVVRKDEVDDATFQACENLSQESSVMVTGEVREDERSTGGFELAVSDKGLTVFQIADEYPAIKYQVPKEGTYGWFDGPVLLKDAPHPNLAYKWIEFITSPEVAKRVAEEVFYSPGNSKVPDMISAELRQKLNLENPEDTLTGLQFWVNLGPEWDRRINDAWTEAKAEAGD